GGNLLGGSGPLALATKLAAFAKANGLGLLGFLPLGGGQSCGGIAVPLLSCLAPGVLARLFAVTDTRRRALGAGGPAAALPALLPAGRAAAVLGWRLRTAARGGP